ncbi:hypothetical protein E4U55_003170 [Claviceps digitariae]|nr:hypothetical protein E4U55_003170 [Claviceps digitariae]
MANSSGRHALPGAARADAGKSYAAAAEAMRQVNVRKRDRSPLVHGDAKRVRRTTDGNEVDDFDGGKIDVDEMSDRYINYDTDNDSNKDIKEDNINSSYIGNTSSSSNNSSNTNTNSNTSNNSNNNDNSNNNNADPPNNVRLICDFCKNHPHGREMHKLNPCNWLSIGGKYILECQNCADHRFSDNPSHICCIGRRKHARQIYASQHPLEYPKDFVCENCKKNSWGNTCDADPILGLSCTSCVTAKPQPEERAKHDIQQQNKASADQQSKIMYECNVCKVGDRELAPKPNLRQGFPKWFRHACDICKNRGKKKNGFRCSWLDSRENWDKPCSRCNELKMLCMSSGKPIDKPSVPEASDKWSTSHSLLAGWAECRGGSPYRQGCRACLDGETHHCRALASEIEYSCSMCWETGIVCWDTKNPELGNYFPLFDFSRVGLGNLCTFSKCTRCKESGRNCDRQRPCDSCVMETKGNDGRDGDGNGGGGSDQVGSCGCDDVNDGYNCIKRLDESPGPIYYLALGYGGRGVDDVKDGSKMEHWIGPLLPLYAIDKKPPTKAEKMVLSQEKKRKMEQLTNDLRDAQTVSIKEAVATNDVDADKASIAESAAEHTEKQTTPERKRTIVQKKPEENRKRTAPKPPAPKTENKMTLTSIAQDMRRALLPPCRPPLATDPLPNTHVDDPGHVDRVEEGSVSIIRVQDKRVDQLSAEDLAAMVQAKWHGGPLAAYPPNKHPKYAEVMRLGRQAVEDLRAGRKPVLICEKRRRSRASVRREERRAGHRQNDGDSFNVDAGLDFDFGVDSDLELLGAEWPASLDETAVSGEGSGGSDGEGDDGNEAVFGSENMVEGSQMFLQQTQHHHHHHHHHHHQQHPPSQLVGHPSNRLTSTPSHQHQNHPCSCFTDESFNGNHHHQPHHSQGSTTEQWTPHLQGSISAMTLPSINWGQNTWQHSGPSPLHISNYPQQLPGSNAAQAPLPMALPDPQLGLDTINPLDMHASYPAISRPGPPLSIPSLCLPDTLQPTLPFMGYHATLPSSSQPSLPPITAPFSAFNRAELAMMYDFQNPSNNPKTTDSKTEVKEADMQPPLWMIPSVWRG